MDTIPQSAELQEAIKKALGLPYDEEILRGIREKSEAVQEEIRRKHGLLDLAVPLIRELRDA